MQFLTLAEIQPAVRITNYHVVAPSQSWPKRYIPDLQLIFIIQGEYAYWEEGEPPVALAPGEVLLIEPNRCHTFQHTNLVDSGCICSVHFEFTAPGKWAANDYRLTLTPERVTWVSDCAYMHERFKRLAEVYSGYHPYRDLQTSTIAREIILLLAGHWRQTTSPDLSPRMQAMILFVRENLQQPLSRQSLAQTFRITPEHVNLLFRKELGMTPSAVINRERVMVAYRLIHEKGHSVKEAAYAVGYADPFYFSRVFKAVFGIPPSHIV